MRFLLGVLIVSLFLSSCTQQVEPEVVESQFEEQELPAVEDPSGKRVLRSAQMNDGTVIEYIVVLPQNYELEKEYPILVALPPGQQTRDMVEQALDLFWETEAMKRGWIIISPIAPDDLFFLGAEQYVPELLAATASEYQPENGLYHLAGVSNGGLSAFKVALLEPSLFRSIVVLGGYPPTDTDLKQLDKLVNIPILMYVGENDTGWLGPMQITYLQLIQINGIASLQILPDEGHSLSSLHGGSTIFDFLDVFLQ